MATPCCYAINRLASTQGFGGKERAKRGIGVLLALVAHPLVPESAKQHAMRALVHTGLDHELRSSAVALGIAESLHEACARHPGLHPEAEVLLALLGVSQGGGGSPRGGVHRGYPGVDAGGGGGGGVMVGRPLRCLCLDGGGSKGLVSIEVLLEIEI